MDKDKGTNKNKQISKVANPEDKAADRKTALSILAQAAALALGLTGVITLLLL